MRLEQCDFPSEQFLMTGFADMISDMVGRRQGNLVEDAPNTIRRITVTFATKTCSGGGETPLIAMEEIKQATQGRSAVILRYKHLFSVEVEADTQSVQREATST